MNMKMKTKLIAAAVLFAISFILDGIASKLLPVEDIIKALLPKKA